MYWFYAFVYVDFKMWVLHSKVEVDEHELAEKPVIFAGRTCYFDLTLGQFFFFFYETGMN